MSVKKRGKVWYAQFMVSGRRYNSPLHKAESKLQAERMEEEDKGRLKEGLEPIWLGTGNQEQPKTVQKFYLLSDALDLYYRKVWAPNQKTATTYKQQITSIIEWSGDIALDKITGAWLIEVREQLQKHLKTNSTINRYIAALNSLLSGCSKKLGIVGPLPVLGKLKETPKKRDKVITSAEYETYRSYFESVKKQSIADLVVFFWATGARLTEPVMLVWDDIDFTKDWVRIPAEVTKKHKERHIHLNEQAMAMLRRRKEHGYETPFGGLKNKNTASNLSKALMRAHKAMTPEGNEPPTWGWHSFRHTMATRLVEAGVEPIVVRDFMGWGSLAMVERYTHLKKDSAAHAADVLTF